MTTVIDAINELLKGVNVAQSRGAFSFKESHDVYMAIEFLNKAMTQPAPTGNASETTTKTPEVIVD